MKRTAILITLCALALFAFSTGHAEDAVQNKAGVILKSASKSMVGVSLSTELGGVSRHYFGPAVFVEWEGSTDSYLLCHGFLWSNGSDNPHYTVYLPSGIKTATLVRSDNEYEYSIIKLAEPWAEAAPIAFSSGPAVAAGERLYLLYTLPQAFNLSSAVKMITITASAKFENTTVYHCDLDVNADAFQGSCGGLVYRHDGSLIGMMNFHSRGSELYGVIVPQQFVKARMSAIATAQAPQGTELAPSANPGWLGAVVSPNSTVVSRYFRGAKPKQQHGVYISGVLADSPADKASLKVMDLLLEVDGVKLTGRYADTEAYFASMEAGKTVKILYTRFNRQVEEWMESEKSITIERRPQTIAEAPKTADEDFGYECAPFTKDLRLSTWILDRYNGVYLTKVNQGSIFYVNGVPEKSLIMKVNGTAVGDPAALKAALAQFKDQKGAVIDILICQPDGYNQPIFRKVVVPRD